MKKTIIFTLLSLALCLPIAAQDVRFGALAGVNLNAPDNLKSEIGYKLGAKAEIRVIRFISRPILGYGTIT